MLDWLARYVVTDDHEQQKRGPAKEGSSKGGQQESGPAKEGSSKGGPAREWPSKRGFQQGGPAREWPSKEVLWFETLQRRSFIR